MKTFLIATLTCAALASPTLTAQVQKAQGTLHRTTAPIAGTYSMTTGFELGAPKYRSGPATIFDNTDGIGYYFSTLSDTEEWIDTVAFTATELNGMEQINGFEFNYCTLLPGPGTIYSEVRFYNDCITGAGPTGWAFGGTIQNAACAYGLAGLPGGGGPFGISCFNINIDLMCGFECSVPQEQTPGGTTDFIGVGWMYFDGVGGGNAGPALGSTWTSAGPGTAVPGYGTQDIFELMDLAVVGAEWQGSFFFGGGAKAQANFDLVLYGDGIRDTDVVNEGVPDINDVLCLGSDMEFRSGNAVTWALDDLGGTAVFPSATYAMLVGTNGSSAGYGSTAGPGTTLLVDPGSLVTPPTPLVMSGIVPSVTTPTLPGLPPTIWAQAMGFNGGVGQGNAAEASNALRHNN